MVLSLPPTPPELKSITPYLQRADEVASTDPVISYWCAYYAAQQGIALKLRDSPARHFLFDLLGLLERLKTDIGPNDAVHDEPASAAYVENFALRVFATADNEDMSGKATRNTAKKFLAAANFLELLRIFDTDKAAIDLPSVEEKIKYAKWKAADTAKAIREGRQPVSGPAASAAFESAIPTAPDLPDVNIFPPTTPPSTIPSLPQTSPPAIVRSTPPPPQLASLPSVESPGELDAPLPQGLAPSQPPQSPGSWSTIATPGTPSFHINDSTSSTRPLAFVSGELEGNTEEEIDAETSPPTSAAKSVHFSPSVVGGVDTPITYGISGHEHDPFAAAAAAAASVAVGPQAEPSSQDYEPPPSAPPLPPPPPAPVTHRPLPPSVPLSGTSYPQAHARGVPPTAGPQGGAATATVTTMPTELTPQTVATVQRHCRFAISALDYEDAEQAVKELKAALRMLGG